MTAKNNLNVLPVEFMLTCTFNMSVSDPPEITVVGQRQGNDNESQAARFSNGCGGPESLHRR